MLVAYGLTFVYLLALQLKWDPPQWVKLAGAMPMVLVTFSALCLTVLKHWKTVSGTLVLFNLLGTSTILVGLLPTILYSEEVETVSAWGYLVLLAALAVLASTAAIMRRRGQQDTPQT